MRKDGNTYGGVYISTVYTVLLNCVTETRKMKGRLYCYTIFTFPETRQFWFMDNGANLSISLL